MSIISEIIIFAGVIAVVHGTFFCGPFEIPSFFKCDEKCPVDTKTEISETCKPHFRCICLPGFKRDKLGCCIPQNDCCPNPNEEFCKSHKPDRTCDNIARTIFFPNKPKKGRCCCKNDTVRNIYGQCVAEIECHQCTGENEVYNPDGCDSLCELRKRDHNECLKKSNGCICKDGYGRQNVDDPDCKPLNECTCDEENQCYMINGGSEKDCQGNKCYEGERGCYCSEGYVLDLKSPGTPCILPKDCCNNM